MEKVVKKENESAMIALNDFQLKYSSLCSKNGLYGISCSCKKCGRVLSHYTNTHLFSTKAAAERAFRLLVENAVFPVHIPDILSDLFAEQDAASVLAIA